MRDEDWDRDINDWVLGKACDSDSCREGLKDRFILRIGSSLAA